MDKDDSETTQLSRPARKRNPEESRRRILDAAERAFSLRGFAGARLRDIAQEAGVHHALVHHYYGDKRGLFQEVVKRGLGRISNAGLATLEGATTLETTPRAFVGTLFDFCANNQNLLRIIEGAFRDREGVSFGVTEEQLGTLAGPLLETLKKRIELGQNTGVVRKDISAESIILLGFGAIVYRFITAESLLGAMGIAPEETDPTTDREHAIQYLLAAMAPR